MKRISFLALCLICTGIFTRCSQSDNNPTPDYHAENLVFETKKVSRSVSLFDDKTEPFLALKYSFAYPKSIQGDTLLSNLQKNILTNIFGGTYDNNFSAEDAVNTVIETISENYRSENREIYTPQAAKLLNFEDIRDMSICYQKGNIVSYKVATYNYTGGANGLAHLVGHIFDFAGNEVAFETVFSDDAKPALIELIKKHFADDYEGESLEKMLEERCVFDFENLPLSENIYLTSNSVVFIYSTMEISCHAGGIFEIAIPIAELTPYFSETSPLKSLIQPIE